MAICVTRARRTFSKIVHNVARSGHFQSGKILQSRDMFVQGALDFGVYRASSNGPDLTSETYTFGPRFVSFPRLTVSSAMGLRGKLAARPSVAHYSAAFAASSGTTAMFCKSSGGKSCRCWRYSELL